MSSKHFFINNKNRLLLLELTLLVLLIIPALLSSFFYIYAGRIYPGIVVAGVNIGGKSPEEAYALVQERIAIPEELLLTYTEDGQTQTFRVPLSSLQLTYNTHDVIKNAFVTGRSGHFLSDLTTVSDILQHKRILPVTVSFNQVALRDFLSVFAGQVAEEPSHPTIKLSGETIVVNRGKNGTELDSTQLSQAIALRLSQLDFSEVPLEVTQVDVELNDEEMQIAEERARKFISKKLVIKHEYDELIFSGQKLLDFINPRGGYSNEILGKVAEESAKKFNNEPQNPVFVFEEGRVKEFAAAKNGISVKKPELVDSIEKSLIELETTDLTETEIAPPVVETVSEYKTGDVNNMGITELIGRGTSRFKGSISSRVHNVALAASRMNGVLIPPGEDFSFNNALGDVSKFTGYKEAYVIQSGKTVLGDGGGVCQVSTTLFRAVMNAGLPITERRGHSYRVGYYEQDSGPGLDATVYSPTTDFKFKNDTGHHILIQTYTDTKNLALTFELYGTKDGRIATLTKPVILSSIAPAEDLYVDDPNLPIGTVKQIEHKAWGAKVSFNYEVKRGEELLYQKTFVTNYRPWQAVFLKGTKPL